MKKVLFVVLLALFLSPTYLFALSTHYNNQVGYENRQGYDNRIPYSAFFNGHRAEPEVKKIQVQESNRRVQKVIHVNTPEEEIEPQRIAE